jgi:hypothetical protein
MKTCWAEVKATSSLRANAGDQLAVIIRDSLGAELGKQALAPADVLEREVPLHDEEFKVLAVVTQFYAHLNVMSDADLAATARLWTAAKALADFQQPEGSPFISVPLDLMEKLREAI